MQDGRVANLAVDTFFTEVSKNDDIGHAIAAASTICRLGALALAEDSEDSEVASHRAYQKCPGWRPGRRQLVFTRDNTQYYCGNFPNEEAARPAAQYWIIHANQNGACLEDIRRHCLEMAAVASNVGNLAVSTASVAAAPGTVCAPALAPPVLLLPTLSQHTRRSAAQDSPVQQHQDGSNPYVPASASASCGDGDFFDFDFNRDGVETIIGWIKASLPGGMLADNMGCGKTRTVIETAVMGKEGSEFGVKAPVVVIAPTKHVPFWGKEFQKWYPNMGQFHGPDYREACALLTGIERRDTRGDWDTAEILLGTGVAPQSSSTSTRSLTSAHWPPRCWIRVIPYEFFWDYERMEHDMFGRGAFRPPLTYASVSC